MVFWDLRQRCYCTQNKKQILIIMSEYTSNTFIYIYIYDMLINIYIYYWFLLCLYWIINKVPHAHYIQSNDFGAAFPRLPLPCHAHATEDIGERCSRSSHSETQDVVGDVKVAMDAILEDVSCAAWWVRPDPLHTKDIQKHIDEHRHLIGIFQAIVDHSQVQGTQAFTTREDRIPNHTMLMRKATGYQCCVS